jgi:hypothetical protein
VLGEIFRQRMKAYIGPVRYFWRRGRAILLQRNIIPELQNAAAVLRDDREVTLRTLTLWLIPPNQTSVFHTLEP